MSEFSDLRERLDWSKAEVARRVGVNRSTVTRWGDEPPEAVLAFLRAMVEIRRARMVLEAFEGLRGGEHG